MAAMSETYVDPSIAGDSGTGTSGDPYGDLQYALNTMTRDATNGDRINVKAGTDEILAAALSFATYGTPAANARCHFEGYTTTAGDGVPTGTAGIDCASTYSCIGGGTIDYIGFKNMHIHKSGAAAIFNVGDSFTFVNCEIENTTGRGLDLNGSGTVFNCHVHTVGTPAIIVVSSSIVYHNYIEVADGSAKRAIHLGGGNCICGFNCIRLTGSGNDSTGIGYKDVSLVFHNSIWSDAGTGTGIMQGSTTNIGLMIWGNVVQGFSGVGGVGMVLSSDDELLLYGANQLYDNATHVTLSADLVGSKMADDVAPTASAPMADPANEDFEANDVIKDTGLFATFKGSATSQFLDAGAAQQEEPAGGGSVVVVRHYRK